MTLILRLPPDLEHHLTQEAQRQGKGTEEYALQLLERVLQRERNAEAIAVLRSFREGDAAEQKETGEYLLRALDEDRLSDRKLFPRS